MYIFYVKNCKKYDNFLKKLCVTPQDLAKTYAVLQKVIYIIIEHNYVKKCEEDKFQTIRHYYSSFEDKLSLYSK